MTYKVVLVTPGQPALNPRLVKEADALTDAGYQVTVFFSYWNSWGSDFTKKLLHSKKWDAICVGGDPVEKPLVYFISRVIYSITRFIVKKVGPINYFAELAATRSAFFLIHEVKKHNADLYIGHNLGALPAIVKAAKKHNAKCGFDAEDFHRNEISDDINSFNFKTAKYLEDKYLTGVDYISASSPQIAGAYQQLYPGKKPITLLNVFPKNTSLKQRSINSADAVKLFWFSQTIGANRGIDDVINALQLLDKNQFELHLLGAPQEGFIDKINSSGISVKFHNPIHPDELTDFAFQFDIGLALEPGFCTNNNLALSNKLFTYMQAGLAIIASDTTAQQDFMSKNSQIGSLYPKGDPKALATILLGYYQNRDELTNCKTQSLRLAHQQYNWETESKKFLSVVKETLLKN